MAAKNQQIFLDLKEEIDMLKNKLEKLDTEKKNNEQKIKQNAVQEQTAISRLYEIVKQDDKTNEKNITDMIKETADQLDKSLKEHAKTLMGATQVTQDIKTRNERNKLRKSLNDSIDARNKLISNRIEMQEQTIDSLKLNQNINNDTLKDLILEDRQQIDTRIEQSEKSYEKMNKLMKTQLKELGDQIFDMNKIINELIATKETAKIKEEEETKTATVDANNKEEIKVDPEDEEDDLGPRFE